MFRSSDSPVFGGDLRDSGAMSTISQTGSTRHILAPSAAASADYLEPPSAPFKGGSSSRPASPSGSTHSLAANYLPSKFSNSLISRRRGFGGKDGGGGAGETGIVPRGGGVAAFRTNAARMPGAADEDYDGVDLRRGAPRPARWTRFKVILFVANTLLSLYSLVALVFTLLVYFRTLKDAPILLVANPTELALSTLAASVTLFTALLGWPGILLNNRPFLAVYTFLLWVCFGLLVVPGYLTYKRGTLNLEGKLLRQINQQWPQCMGAAGRLTVQSALGCCGYFSPFVEGTVSSSCYSRSVPPGCKEVLLALTRWYTAVPVHIGILWINGFVFLMHF
ncbi:hypothetical protein DFH06DRAFT_1291066 [Mycena polygramma]|nr:hypothetical protein DFH06DRAFT_1291066 [Mycena polygramma]